MSPLSTGVPADVKLYTPPVGGFKALLYGVSGSGKTTAALSASLSDAMSPVLVINTDYGMTGAYHLNNVRVIDLRSWKNLDWLVTELLKPDSARVELLQGIRTIVLDSLSSLRDFVLAEIAREEAEKNRRGDQYIMQLQDYNRALIIISQFIARVRMLDVNIIMTAAVEYEKSGDTIMMAYPDLYRALRNQVNYMVDMIWPLEKSGGKYFMMVTDSAQTVYLQKTRNAKFRASLADKTDKGWLTIPTPDYETLPILYDLWQQSLNS